LSIFNFQLGPHAKAPSRKETISIFNLDSRFCGNDNQNTFHLLTFVPSDLRTKVSSPNLCFSLLPDFHLLNTIASGLGADSETTSFDRIHSSATIIVRASGIIASPPKS
jgi:hypothetical protein